MSQESVASSGAGREPAPRMAIAFALVVLTLAVYAQAAGHGFVNLDDSAYVVANPVLRLPLTPGVIADYFTRPVWVNWSPLTLLTYHLNYSVHELEFAGYLWTNLALHLLATLLLFAALDRMTGRVWPSAFVAAVFAIHPLHVESVAWISSRKDVLAGCFWMAGLLAYARHVERPGWGRYAVLLACLLLGLLSKPLLVTFPCVLLLLDHWPLRRLSRRAWLEKLPMFALVGVVAAITVAVQRGGAATAFADYYDLSLASRLANAIDSYVGYLGQSFWPSGLAVHYPHPRETLAVRRVVLAALLLLTCSGLAAWSWRRRPWLAVGWLWFLGVLVPMLGLVQVGSQARADRYMYVPLVGLAIALAWGVPELLTRLRAPRGSARLLGCAVVLGLAAAAWLQVGHWRGSATLFAHAVAVEPESFFGNRGLGLVRIEQGRWQEAELLLERGFALRPDQGGPALVRLHLLQARRAQQAGEVEAFRARLTRVLEIEPAHPGASGILGVAAVREGRFVEARPLLERALAEPDAAASVHAAMGMLELVAGNGAAAARHSRAALRLDPQLAWAANNLAWILATSPDPELRDPEQAVALAEQVVAGEPDPDPNHLDTLAAAYAAAGRGEEAVATAERGIRRAEAEAQPELAATLRARRAHYRAGGSLSES